MAVKFNERHSRKQEKAETQKGSNRIIRKDNPEQRYTIRDQS